MPSPGADSDAARHASLDGAPGLRHRGHHFMRHVHDRMDDCPPLAPEVEHTPSVTYLCMPCLTDRHPKVTLMHPRRRCR